MKKKQETELQRTCNRCNTVWYAKQETKPKKLLMAGVKMQSKGARMSWTGKKAAARELQIQSLEQKRERIEAAERCSSCGSSSFTEQQVAL